MKRRARTVLLVITACLAAACVGIYLWLPWNPFEEDAGPLDDWVPADVDALVRLDAGALQRADAVRTLWAGPAGKRLREAFALDDVVSGIADVDATLAKWPGAPTVAGDFLGREVLVALRDDEFLVLARVSGRAKAIDLLRRAGDERRSRWGIEFDADADSYEVTEGSAEGWRFARRRDVLIASMSDDLFEDSLALAAGKGDAIAGKPEYRDVRPPAPHGATIGVWSTGAFAGGLADDPPLVGRILAPAFEHAVRLDLDATAADAIHLTAKFAGDPKEFRDVSDLAARARPFAGGAVASGALPVSARDAVTALLDSQPPARRKLVGDLLAESGSSVAQVVDELARPLADGAGFVVSRPSEIESFRLDDADGDARNPIPRTFAVFRLANADADGFVRDLQRHAEALFGPNARLVEKQGPAGSRVFVPEQELPFGPEWALLRPGFAIAGDEVVFCTWWPALLETPAKPAAAADAGAVAILRIDAARMHEQLRDLRWDHADRETYHDWAQERAAFERDLDRRRLALTPEERRRREDEEIARRIKKRKSQEFPEAERRYVESLTWLDAFTHADLRCVEQGGGLRLDATIGIRVR